MLRIGDIIFSLDILEKRFKCDLDHCLGNCCRYGDSGAPLSDEEVSILEEIWPDLRPYLRPEGINVIENEGTSVIDFENDYVTPLIGNEECAYALLEGNIYMCGIEKAWSEGKIEFRKPVSCHLFPVRVKKFRSFTAVNYQELAICSHARECGSNEGIYVYEFLKTPLLRVFGDEVYNELCIAARELRKGG
ncbi:MAG: DUF3109 family protein [Bacteroidales bacterium]|nr:DUF3109 family protein [Bacteroidales bacterium]